MKIHLFRITEWTCRMGSSISSDQDMDVCIEHFLSSFRTSDKYIYPAGALSFGGV